MHYLSRRKVEHLRELICVSRSTTYYWPSVAYSVDKAFLVRKAVKM